MPADLPSLILGTLVGGPPTREQLLLQPCVSRPFFVAPSPAAVASQQLLGPKPRALSLFTMTLSCTTYSSGLLHLAHLFMTTRFCFRSLSRTFLVLADNIEPTQQLPPLSLPQLVRDNVLPLQHPWRRVLPLVNISEPTQPFGFIFRIAFMLRLSGAELCCLPSCSRRRSLAAASARRCFSAAATAAAFLASAATCFSLGSTYFFILAVMHK
ncbi:hypothetical protein MHU86_21716 [Fragilaria crotonensis]|nr:hypothetical protein MHU86_21716 [Fragilaria crotonensis]